MSLRIGVLGLAVRSLWYVGGNLGCHALSFSFFYVLDKIAAQNNQKIELVCISQIKLVELLKKYARSVWHTLKKDKVRTTEEYYNELYPHLRYKVGYYLVLFNHIVFLSSIRRCNCIFDFTAGDSFTDIYGEERFYQRTRIKEKVIRSKIPLILGSQTIGPFKSDKVKDYARKVIKASSYVFVRDELSKRCVEEITSVSPVLTNDVAFFLPYDQPANDGMKRAGFNPSGLLWEGGYNRSNQFGLTVDYKEYCRSVIRYLLETGYEVHLILHAYWLKENMPDDYPDNDRLAVEALHQEFPTSIVSPYFHTPMEAKSYIANMNIFIGARMHATIAAISANVPVIPFSYSRKFEGLFSSLHYPYIIEGRNIGTKDAITKTCKWIDNINELEISLSGCKQIIKEKNDFLLNSYSKVISSFIQ